MKDFLPFRHTTNDLEIFGVKSVECDTELRDTCFSAYKLHAVLECRTSLSNGNFKIRVYLTSEDGNKDIGLSAKTDLVRIWDAFPVSRIFLPFMKEYIDSLPAWVSIVDACAVFKNATQRNFPDKFLKEVVRDLSDWRK